jgi:hypothetical protein
VRDDDTPCVLKKKDVDGISDYVGWAGRVALDEPVRGA